jgi:hypothetical protein
MKSCWEKEISSSLKVKVNLGLLFKFSNSGKDYLKMVKDTQIFWKLRSFFCVWKNKTKLTLNQWHLIYVSLWDNGSLVYPSKWQSHTDKTLKSGISLSAWYEIHANSSASQYSWNQNRIKEVPYIEQSILPLLQIQICNLETKGERIPNSQKTELRLFSSLLHYIQSSSSFSSSLSFLLIPPPITSFLEWVSFIFFCLAIEFRERKGLALFFPKKSSEKGLKLLSYI